VVDRIFAGLTSDSGRPKQLIIEAAHLRARRTAASLLKKLYADVSGLT